MLHTLVSNESEGRKVNIATFPLTFPPLTLLPLPLPSLPPFPSISLPSFLPSFLSFLSLVPLPFFLLSPSPSFPHFLFSSIVFSLLPFPLHCTASSSSPPPLSSLSSPLYPLLFLSHYVSPSYLLYKVKEKEEEEEEEEEEEKVEKENSVGVCLSVF